MEQPIVRLNFTCDRNWDDMIPIENGRFCNDCQKNVVDFTGKTNDEIAAYLISSTVKVCGRFQNTQLSPALPKPLWKRWLSAAAMFFTVFMGIKEASAQKLTTLQPQLNKGSKVNSYFDDGAIGMVAVSLNPSFPGGEKAFDSYFIKNLHFAHGIKGRVITAFTVEKNGKLTGIKILKGLNKEADREVLSVLKKCPNWNPGVQNGRAVKVSYTLPIKIGKEI